MYPRLVTPDGDGWRDLPTEEDCPGPEIWKPMKYNKGVRRRVHDPDCPECGGTGSCPSLAALALPGDRVLWDVWPLPPVEAVFYHAGGVDFRKAYVRIDNPDAWTEEAQFQQLARIVTPETEAARAAVHPALDYPLP